MSKLTLLSLEECDKSDIIIQRGTHAEATDFARLLGNSVEKIYNYIDNEHKITATYATSSYESSPYKFTYNLSLGDYLIDDYGYDIYQEDPIVIEGEQNFSVDKTSNYFGIRPVIKFENILDIPTNGTLLTRAKDGLIQVEYGFYPQDLASQENQKILEKKYKEGQLQEVKNEHYTTNSINSFQETKKEEDIFIPEENKVYIYNGEKYVRISTKNASQDMAIYGEKAIPYSNGMRYYSRKDVYVWVKVEPVKWIVDEENKEMIAEKVLVSGIYYDYDKPSRNRFNIFEDTYLYKFMNEILALELEQEKQSELLGSVEVKKRAEMLEIKISDIKKFADEGISIYQKLGQKYNKYIKSTRENNLEK